MWRMPKPGNRKDLVHTKFITRWAYRFLEIRDKHGSHAANAWANSFLNDDDIPAIAEEIRRIVTE